MNATRFSFGDDLRAPATEAAVRRLEIDEIEARARREGHESGRREAEAEIQGRLVAAVETVGATLAGVMAELDRQITTIEDDALALALALARTVAGRALDAHPVAAVAEVAAEAFGHLRGVPHLVARVHESLVETVESLVTRMARERGFEGRIVVLGDPDIAPGDARLEWADGGIVRERRLLESQIADALAAVRPEGALTLSRRTS